jgi:hypothetical protein
MAELEDQVADLEASSTQFKTEVKTLATKLAAARAVDPTSVRVPGSAIKGTSGTNRLAVNAEAAAQAAQMKEDLYADITGLIIRGVKRDADGDVYDCIQTGRNGSKSFMPSRRTISTKLRPLKALHFKLSLGSEDASESFEEAQIVYLPQLDADRDQELIDILPDYLVEEISFPRPHAARFYARVMKSLTE